MLSTSKLIFGILCLALNSCSSSKHAIPLNLPSEALENAIQNPDNDALLEEGEMIPPDWWILFNDPQLDECIQKTIIRNPSLQSAQTKILSAGYNAARIRSALYPYFYWGADVSRQKLSKTGVIPFASGPAGSNTRVINVPIPSGSMIPEYFTLYETELNVKYSFDFWHKNRNALRAALGIVKANIAEAAFVRLELSIAVAQTYYQLQVDYKRRELALGYQENRQKLFEFIQKRINANLDNEIALQFAESNLVDAKNLVLQLEEDIAINEHQLMAYMAGNFDEEILPINLLQQPLPKVPVPENLPLHLISQRPDINAQIWMIRSAGRQIKVAQAGFYPDFNLAAFFGFQTIHFRELFKWPSTFFNVDPAVTLPIFDGGRLLADLQSSEIKYDLAILDYNQSIIDAAKDVLDALSLLRISHKRLEEYELKLGHQNELYRLTNLRVTHNLGNILDLLTSEANVIEAQDQEIVSIGKSTLAILALIKALGGGYINCEG